PARGGGAGGCGGGGGGTADQASATPGPRGLGGGSGGDGNPSEPEKSGGFGGGGAGCGGALFVSESSSTTLSYTSSVAATAPFSGNSVTAGAGPEATDGEAVGPNIFLRGGGVLKFDIDGPVTLKLPSMIKTDPSEPFSTITKLGGGTLIMDPVSQDSDVNDFKSLINLNQGTIVIDDDNQLGNEDSELIFNGGILKNSSSSFGINRLTDLEGNGTFEVENGTTLNQNGDISGSGALTKTGAGTLILSGTNTYTGGTVISDGILSVSSSDRLGSGDLTFNGGSLKITSPLFSYSRNMNLAGTGTFDVAELSLVELSGVLSGAGGLTKEGSGDLILSGVNTYSGRTIINGGGLSLSGTLGAAKDLLINGGSFVIPEGAGEKTVNVLNGSGTIDNLGDNVLDLGSGDYSGTIRGTGTLKKVGAGTLRLSGDNTFTGDLILDGGTLSFSSDNNLGTGTLRLNGGTLSPSGSTTTEKEIDIGVASQIDVADGIDLTLSGTLTGQGNLEKTGPGKMILTGSSPVPERITTVQQGILSVNGTVEGPVNISPAATLMGTGTVGSVGNDGTVSPGNSIGTLSINGDYTQGSSAFLTVEIDDDPADSDLMIVSGTADLDGSLIVVPLPGIYEAGTTYTFLQADAVTGQFKQLLRNHPLDFVINYLADAVQIQIAFNGYTLPEDIDSLSGNTKKIATYLFSDSTFIENDLISILKPLVRLSPREFSDGLLQLGPEQFGALALSNLRMSVSTGQAMNRAAAIYDDYFSNDYRSARKSGSDCDRSIWFNPIGYYYKQNKIDDRVPFNSRTYGFTTGYSALFSKHLVVSAGLGYSRSNLHWYRDNGNAVIQSFSLSPSVGYLGKQGYVGIMVAGGRSFYDVDRKIHFSNIKRTAHNDHKSYDVLAGFTGALNLKFPDKFQTNLFLLPIVNLDYLNIFESGYRESGAGVIDLAVKKVRSSFLRPEIKVKLLKQLMTDTLRAFPNIYAGWLKNIPLTDGNYTSKLYKQQTVDGNFTVRGYDSSTDEAVLGAELLVNHKEHCSIKIGYEINIGHRYRVQEVGINIHRRF
ncbi:MAG: autotransporter domain-containing protein, partial [Chlamydiota bacterium]